VHRLRRLRGRLPQRVGDAVHGRQDHPPRRAAAGPARALRPGPTATCWAPCVKAAEGSPSCRSPRPVSRLQRTRYAAHAAYRVRA
jgi:hypothetical protein